MTVTEPVRDPDGLIDIEASTERLRPVITSQVNGSVVTRVFIRRRHRRMMIEQSLDWARETWVQLNDGVG